MSVRDLEQALADGRILEWYIDDEGTVHVLLCGSVEKIFCTVRFGDPS